MDNDVSEILDALGGTTAVAKITHTPPSTVHSWRKNGIPPSRAAHLKLAAEASGKPVPPGLVRILEAAGADALPTPQSEAA